jgi:RNA polymerase sigma-70 factor (ECF subfamily)
MADWNQLNRGWADAPDADLIRATLDGDDEAFRALCGRYGPVLSAYLAGRTPATADADDLLQEVLLKAYRGLHGLRSRQAFGAWIVKIARRELAEFHRSRRRDGPIAEDAATAKPDLIEAREVSALVLAALGELKDGYREVVYLRLVEEWSTAEIAMKLGMREGSVRMRAARGIAMLREKLNRKGIEW